MEVGQKQLHLCDELTLQDAQNHQHATFVKELSSLLEACDTDGTPEDELTKQLEGVLQSLQKPGLPTTLAKRPCDKLTRDLQKIVYALLKIWGEKAKCARDAWSDEKRAVLEKTCAKLASCCSSLWPWPLGTWMP